MSVLGPQKSQKNDGDIGALDMNELNSKAENKEKR
jgi:hypothetical protein